MQRLEVSGAVRPIYGSLGVKRLSTFIPNLILVERSKELLNTKSRVFIYFNHVSHKEHRNVMSHVIDYYVTPKQISICSMWLHKGKDKGHPRTGHKGPEGE